MTPDRSSGVAAWLILTVSGSAYVVARGDEGEWWLGGGSNVPNPNSVALPSGLWAIEPPEPWPPVLGWPLALLALRSLDVDDPARAPGGGKVTSAVVAATALDLTLHTDASRADEQLCTALPPEEDE